ncbi:MAG: hypothetical protein M1839_002265 [Geoglossum umbratile]|nr:MAG: hypothetical protein M1839_002265 [Geoglossum umbratile]
MAAIVRPVVNDQPTNPETPILGASIGGLDGADLKSASLETARGVICFSDFDGTIFTQDTGHILSDGHGRGSKRRETPDEQIKCRERSFRDVSEEMWGSLDVPFDDGFEVMKARLDIDPDFQRFHKFCVDNSIPFNIISAGLKPILRRVLDTFLDEDESAHIETVANDAEINPDGSNWKPIWRYDCNLGCDRVASITEYRSSVSLEGADGSMPLIIFIGDGVSDLPAAREADVLFARRGLRLEEYCVEHKIPYIPFQTFADIQREVTRIVVEDREKTGGVGKPATYNPGANLWRRVSGRKSVNPGPSRFPPLPLDDDTLSILREAIASATIRVPGMQEALACSCPSPIFRTGYESPMETLILGSPLSLVGSHSVVSQ